MKRFVLCSWVVTICILVPHSLAGQPPVDTRKIIEKMEAAYSKVTDYQAHLWITGFGKDRTYLKVQELLYTFKKPNKIRLDFEAPHQGMVVIYPQEDGKVLVRPYAWLPFFTLSLEPNNSLLEISPGQQINETDLGVLIRNIALSTTDLLQGDLLITQDSTHIVIRVLAENPFLRGTMTRYRFFIDTDIWLPVKVDEFSAEGILKRTVDYRHLKINRGVPDSFFELE